MKTVRVLSVFLIISSFLIGCNNADSDENNKENELIFDGKTHPLLQGNLMNYLDLDPIFEYEIALYSSPLNENHKPTDSIYNVFDFKIKNHGTTNGNNKSVEGIIGSSLIFFNAEPGVNRNLEAYYVSDGSAKVKKSGNKYTITIEGIAKNALDEEDNREIEFSGYYEGTLHNSENFED